MPLWPGGESPSFPGAKTIGGALTVGGAASFAGAASVTGTLTVGASLTSATTLTVNASTLLLSGSGNNGLAVDNNGFLVLYLGRFSVGASLNTRSLTEVTTIAAAATTDTVIQIPAGAVVRGVAVRVNTVIPTAATFTVTGTTSGTTFSTTGVSTAAGTTDAGTAGGAYYNATAQSIRITPDLTPGAATGVIRIVLFYDLVTPPSA